MRSIGGLAGSGWVTLSLGTSNQTLTRPRSALPAGARTKISANKSTDISNALIFILAPAGSAKL
eukprot:911447-Pelagomonas_calceolata.AAC.3